MSLINEALKKAQEGKGASSSKWNPVGGSKFLPLILLAVVGAGAGAWYFLGEGVPDPVVVTPAPVKPVASNSTPEGRAKNRRIEIRLRPIPPED